MNWPETSRLPWKQRNAAIEAAAREWLAGYCGPPLSTAEMAWALNPAPEIMNGEPTTGALAKLLAKIAPNMGPIATHDGPTVAKFGRSWTRWRWHGQYQPKGVSSND